MLTLYNVTSKDGFVAAKDGGEDFIPDDVWEDFLVLLRNHDTLIFGKTTYDALYGYTSDLIESFEHTPCKKIVMTRDTTFVPKSGYIVVHSLDEAREYLQGNTLLCSGPHLNTVFLREHLIDNVIINLLPESIGEGLRQFEDGVSVELKELSRSSRGDRMLITYTVVK
jgi:dihydrofolate reductase